MDPLSIITGSITLYSAASSLKKFKDSCSEAPEFISELLEDCNQTLKILLHAKFILRRLDRALVDKDAFGPVNIRNELKKNIASLQPDIETLREQLTALEHPAKTNYDLWKKRVKKILRKSQLEESHKKISKKLDGFERIRRSLDRQACRKTYINDQHRLFPLIYSEYVLMEDQQ